MRSSIKQIVFIFLIASAALLFVYNFNLQNQSKFDENIKTYLTENASFTKKIFQDRVNSLFSSDGNKSNSFNVELEFERKNNQLIKARVIQYTPSAEDLVTDSSVTEIKNIIEPSVGKEKIQFNMLSSKANKYLLASQVTDTLVKTYILPANYLYVDKLKRSNKIELYL